MQVYSRAPDKGRNFFVGFFVVSFVFCGAAADGNDLRFAGNPGGSGCPVLGVIRGERLFVLNFKLSENGTLNLSPCPGAPMIRRTASHSPNFRVSF